MKITIYPVYQSFPHDLSIRFFKIKEGSEVGREEIQVYAVSAMEMYAAKLSAFDVIAQYIRSSEPATEVVQGHTMLTIWNEALDEEIFISIFQKGMESTFKSYLESR